MAESHILIELFLKLKDKIHVMDSKNMMMDAKSKEALKEVVAACNNMDTYIDSFTYKEEHIIPIGLTYDQPYFSLTPTPRGHAGPTAAMRRYAAQEEAKQMKFIDQVIQMGRDMDANKDTPYFTIN